MPAVMDFPARGKVIEVRDGLVVFMPANTNYELHLKIVGDKYTGPVGTMVEGLIRIQARKVYTVPSGGNFITPIFGPPRIVQGRVRFISDKTIVLHAATPVIVELPAADTALDLENGAIGASNLVNCTVLPGATFELMQAAVAR